MKNLTEKQRTPLLRTFAIFIIAIFQWQSLDAQLIALKAHNGQYVCAENGGGGEVVANRNALGSWEKFSIKNLGNGKIALRASNGQYVCAEGGGGGAVVANRDARGTWETFTLEVLDANFNADKFSFIIFSDPQYPWTCKVDGDDCDDTDQAKKDNKAMVDKFNQLKSSVPNLMGVIINGDLTAFGHASHLKKFKEFYEEQLALPMYPGLGNHDYANNIVDGKPDCTPGCAGRMIWYFDEKLKSIPGLSRHPFTYGDRTYTGSLAYSWNVGDVHFVQLNNYSSYTNKWVRYNWDKVIDQTFNITSSLNWLKSDLQTAKDQGKRIILNFHDHGEHGKENSQHYLSADGVSISAKEVNSLTQKEYSLGNLYNNEFTKQCGSLIYFSGYG